MSKRSVARPSTEERFWAKVEKTGPDECWEWLASTKDTGYGFFYLGSNGRRNVLAHRYSYELHRGPIPDGLVIDHLCRNRGCVNPAHMEAVTQTENNRRSESPSGVNGRKTHCKYGHEFTPENTIPDRGGRKCLECKRRAHREYMARRRAEEKALAALEPRVEVPDA